MFSTNYNYEIQSYLGTMFCGILSSCSIQSSISSLVSAAESETLCPMSKMVLLFCQHIFNLECIVIYATI